MKMIAIAVLLSVVAASSAAPGSCPSVTTTYLPDLTKAMGLWWRPFRSQFNSEEAIFKCLSTEWSELEGKRFKVVDNNQLADDGQKIKWNGFITAQADPADWAIEFDESANNMKVSAQVLDFIEDEYMFMYVCVPHPETNTHDENGIIFTRQKNVRPDQMRRYEGRAARAMRRNRLQHISMLPIDLKDC